MSLKFLCINRINLTVGEPLRLNIYLHISKTKAVKIFNANDILLKEDLDKINSFKKQSVLILKDDYDLMCDQNIESMCIALKNDSTFSPLEGSSIAKNVFASQGTSTNAEFITTKANEVVSALFDIPSNERATYLLELINQAESSVSAYTLHANQVSAVSVIIALTQPGLDINHLTEVSLGVFLHGAGLQALVDPLAENELETILDFSNLSSIDPIERLKLVQIIKKHINGHVSFEAFEEDIYLKQMNIVEQCFRNNGQLKMTPGLKKTISDFNNSQNVTRIKSISLHNAYLPSKILLIGDRLVSYLNFYKGDEDCMKKSVMALRKSSRDPKNYTLFDHNILDSLESIL